jgi:hypothetical protein
MNEASSWFAHPNTAGLQRFPYPAWFDARVPMSASECLYGEITFGHLASGSRGVEAGTSTSARNA